MQTIAYSILWDFQFLLRNFALIGALLLVLAEARIEGRSLFAGVPSLGDNKPKNFMQLAGRILLAFMFITLIRFELSVWNVIQDIIGSTLMVLVVLGYKTKLSALILVALLTVLNLYHNAWWTIPSYKPLRDFLKYDFFQVILVSNYKLINNNEFVNVISDTLRYWWLTHDCVFGPRWCIDGRAQEEVVERLGIAKNEIIHFNCDYLLLMKI